MATALSVQQRLHALGLYGGALDGKIGPWTIDAMNAALDKLATFLPPPTVNASFDPVSAKRLGQAHPLLQKLMNAARERMPVAILDSQRGRAEQELAFKRGTSKAHFGQSAHNWSPSIAVDAVPVDAPGKVDWSDLAAFKAMGKIIGCFNPNDGTGYGLAKELKIGIRWLGDPNFDGSFADGWDFPHFELHGVNGWRSYVSQSRPYEG